MTHPIKKRIAQQRPIKPVMNKGELWDKPTKGRDLSVGNVVQDVERGVDVIREQPEDFTSYLRNRLRSYQDQGPDINKPVPLTRNPYRTRRK